MKIKKDRIRIYTKVLIAVVDDESSVRTPRHAVVWGSINFTLKIEFEFFKLA